MMLLHLHHHVLLKAAPVIRPSTLVSLRLLRLLLDLHDLAAIQVEVEVKGVDLVIIMWWFRMSSTRKWGSLRATLSDLEGGIGPVRVVVVV